MQLGYVRNLTKSNTKERQISLLETCGIEEWFEEHTYCSTPLRDQVSVFQELVDYAQPGDVVWVESLAVFSRDYRLLVKWLDVFLEQRVSLKVYNLPEATLESLLDYLRWTLQNERFLEPSYKVFNIAKGESKQAQKYSSWAKDPDLREMTKEVKRGLAAKQTVRQIARDCGVSESVVIQLKKRREKLKNTIWLIALFFITVISMKMASYYSQSFWIQLVISCITTLIIFAMSYYDTHEETS